MNLPSINVEGSGHIAPIIINDEQTINPQQDSVYILSWAEVEVMPHLTLGVANVPIGCKVTVLPSINRIADFGYVTYKNIAKIDNTVLLLTGCSATFVFTDEGTWDVLSGASFYMNFATYYGLSSSMKQKQPSNWKHITGSGTYYFRYSDQPDSAYMLPKDAETMITVINGALYNYSGSSTEFLHIPGTVIATAYTDINTRSATQKYPTIYTIGGQGNRTGSEGAYIPEITWNTRWELTHKVGQVHNVQFESGFSGNGQWCVQNGICIVNFHSLINTVTGDSIVVSKSLPPSKFPNRVLSVISNGKTGTRGCVFLAGSGETGSRQYLYCTTGTTGNGYATFSYPVADDWVES